MKHRSFHKALHRGNNCNSILFCVVAINQRSVTIVPRVNNY